MPCRRCQRSGQSAQTHPNFDYLIVRSELGKIDNPPGCMFMHKEILAKFFVRGQPFSFENLFGFFVGHQEAS